jgi:two-component system phosphate regulon response regulator PhoB
MSHILVVEDDADIRDYLSFRLELDGHRVTTAIDGLEGLAAAHTDPPDLILVDWMMPRMTGLELCLQVTDDPDLGGTPVIMLTARSQEVDVERGFAAGATDYLVKPFSAVELSSRVTSALRLRAR